MIIKDSEYKTTEEILRQLSIENIGPCSIIPEVSLEIENMLDFDKNLFIKTIVDANDTVLAEDFTVTRHGTFFVDSEGVLMRFTARDPSKIRPAKESENAVFESIKKSAELTVKRDSNLKSKTVPIQTVTHKIKAMNKINLILNKRLQEEKNLLSF